MRQLRPHLTRATFLARVRRQRRAQGYTLICLQEDGEPRALAGYRTADFLAWGRTLYIDDLVTDARHRGRGYGGQLLAWLVARARAADCDEVHLDSGVQRYAAHRIYHAFRFEIRSHHFSLRLK
jgi:GNAT superfamily N-acetyltransferase